MQDKAGYFDFLVGKQFIQSAGLGFVFVAPVGWPGAGDDFICDISLDSGIALFQDFPFID